MRALYRTGLGNKIIRIKAGDALRNALQFESAEDEAYYKARVEQAVKQAARWCLAFGRGIVVIHHRGDDLSKPLGAVDSDRVLLSVFSGDMISVGLVDMDLQSPTYYRPLMYNARGVSIHHTRVVDFCYVRPPEVELPMYRYGGISEFELIYEQVIADGIVQRASPRVVDKASTMIYKVAGFKDLLASGQEETLLAYFQTMESTRISMSACVVDAEDAVEAVNQTISNLSDADQITLRRLAMVAGISVTRMIGEAPRGMNSSGDQEAQMDRDMLETLQQDYFLDPINTLMQRLGQGPVQFRENQGETPTTRIAYETQAIDNALKLQNLGEDYTAYLVDKGIVQVDEYDALFSGPESTPQTGQPDVGDPTSALDGTQGPPPTIDTGDKAPWVEGGKFGSGGGAASKPGSGEKGAADAKVFAE